MSYKARGGSGYNTQRKRSLSFKKKGKNKADQLAQKNFASRNLRSRSIDLIRLAPIAPNIEAYLKAPNRYDWPGVDCIEGSLPEQAQEISKLSKNQQDVKIVVKNKADDTAKPKQFKVVEKDKVQKETEKELKIIETEAKVSKRRLPTTEEIYQEAVRLWRKENTKPIHEGFLENVADPTRQELQEEGFLNQAKLNLMTSDDTEATRQTLDYVDNIRVELEKIGFTVIPIEGFSSEDLVF
ncbi:MAG: hypothetical protein IAX22_04810 [Candidatus Bathyarchaeota archaeon]|nr:hypothetical protein [Candidatus Bathyarchaeota archaeon]